jgi:hypothetical protein
VDNKRRTYNAAGTYKLDSSHPFPVAAGNSIDSRSSAIDNLGCATYYTTAGVAFLVHIIPVLRVDLIEPYQRAQLLQEVVAGLGITLDLTL